MPLRIATDVKNKQRERDLTAELNIGETIVRLRENRELSQDGLARAADISASFLSRVENGEKGLSQETCERLASALKVPVSFLYLLSDQGDSPLVRELQESVWRSLRKEKAKAQSSRGKGRGNRERASGGYGRGSVSGGAKVALLPQAVIPDSDACQLTDDVSGVLV